LRRIVVPEELGAMVIPGNTRADETAALVVDVDGVVGAREATERDPSCLARDVAEAVVGVEDRLAGLIDDACQPAAALDGGVVGVILEHGCRPLSLGIRGVED